MLDSYHFRSIILKTDIYLGAYHRIFTLLNNRHVVLITDENLASLYPHVLKLFPYIVLPAGEETKSLSRIEFVLNKLMEMKVDRDAVLLGFGGGVITDITGFVASIYKRGVSFAFLPTSLLGMVDAAIGGKNGVNFNGIKNQIGTVNQALFTWIDTSFLNTLPYLHFLNGFAELVKTSLIFSKKTWVNIQTNREIILKTKPDYLQSLIAEAVQHKMKLVEQDPYDNYHRQILNFGHSFGHVIEMTDKILHGLAVSKGMVAAIKLSVAAGYLSRNLAKEIIQEFEALGLPIDMDFKAEYFILLDQDKKQVNKNINFIFLKEIGSAMIENVDTDTLKKLAYDARSISF
jgi:3-dehydroquinate synthase